MTVYEQPDHAKAMHSSISEAYGDRIRPANFNKAKASNPYHRAGSRSSSTKQKDSDYLPTRSNPSRQDHSDQKERQ